MIYWIFSHCYATLHACFRSVCLLVDPSVVKVFSKIFVTILAFQSFSREVDFWLNHHGQPNGWSSGQTKPFFRVVYPQQRTQVCKHNKERVFVWMGPLDSPHKKIKQNIVKVKWWLSKLPKVAIMLRIGVYKQNKPSHWHTHTSTHTHTCTHKHIQLLKYVFSHFSTQACPKEQWTEVQKEGQSHEWNCIFAAKMWAMACF